MNKPYIGVVPLVDEDRDSLWMLPGYMDAVTHAGGIPLMLPLTDDPNTLDRLIGLCGGFLLTGGQDVDPALYGETPLPACGPACAALDRMELALLDHAIAADKAVFGICRGIQLLNVAQGGTLYQDLPTQHPSGVDHHMTPPYDRVVHQVDISSDTLLGGILPPRTLGVNSYHHQAIRTLGRGLLPAAYSEDGLVEAVVLSDRKFVLAVQWHPEHTFRTDPDAAALFAAFVDAST